MILSDPGDRVNEDDLDPALEFGDRLDRPRDRLPGHHDGVVQAVCRRQYPDHGVASSARPA